MPVVNFGQEMAELIKETKYLDGMGYQVPQQAMVLALNEAQIADHCSALKEMLANLLRVTRSVAPVESALLTAASKELNDAMLKGFDYVCWRSQRISDYVAECNLAIKRFDNVCDTVRSSARDLDMYLQKIEQTTLVQQADFADLATPLDLGLLRETIDGKSRSRLEPLVEDYAAFEQILRKLETDVVGTNTGASKQMAGYYFYWEKRVYNAIVAMVVRSLATWTAILTVAQGTPLTAIRANFDEGDLVVSPRLNDVFKALSGVAASILTSASGFVRWQFDHTAGHGTCLFTPDLIVSEDEDPIVFSFLDDVAANPTVRD